MKHSSLLVLAPAGLAAGGMLVAQDPAPPRIVLGQGAHRYEWVSGWGALPDGMSLGNTHGAIVTDAAGNVYVNTDAAHAVVVFDRAGKYLRSFGKDLAGGLHGMAVAKDGGRESLLLVHTGQGKLLKTTLEGEVLWSVGCPEKSGVYPNPGQYRPTSVAVGPDGDLYVADGYGLSYVHRFDGSGAYKSTIGGPGAEPGKFRTPHGIMIDTRGPAPALLVADRENNRLQSFDLDGGHLKVIAGDLRRPCSIHQQGKHLVVADLAGRVTILDENDRLVVHLGENSDPGKWARNDVLPPDWKDGEFVSPHNARWDAGGNLIVMDWVSAGRVTFLRRVQAP